MKICKKCNKNKADNSFGKDIYAKSGLSTYCKQCEAKRSKERRKRPGELEHIRKYDAIRRLGANGKYDKIKARAKRAKINYCTRVEFVMWFNIQKHICHYCGVEEEIAPVIVLRKDGIRQLEIDRKDNRIGYIPDNMTLACHICNKVKNNVFTEQEMLEIAEKHIKRRVGVQKL